MVELLVVLAIVAILAAISFPAIGALMGSLNLNAAQQTVLGQLAFARQSALASNRAVEVRFYQIADYRNSGATVYGGIQCFREETSSSGAAITTPLTKPYFLPSPLSFVGDAAASSLLVASGATPSGATVVAAGDNANPLPPPRGAAPYVCFCYRPNGQTDLSAASTLTLTLASQAAPIVANNLPANFVTLQIDAINGTLRTFRP